VGELNGYITVTINVADTSVTRAGFGVPMIMANHAFFSDLIRTYTSAADMVTDGFPTGHPAYLAAAAVFAQNPRPTSVKVGKRATLCAQVVHLTPSAVAVTTYTVVVKTQAGVATTISYTSDATPSATEITGGITTAWGVAAPSGVTCTDDTTKNIIVNTTDGQYFALYAYTNNPSDGTTPLWTRDEQTADAGIATDMAAIIAADNNWDILICADIQDGAGIAAAAAWAETNGKYFAASSPDEDILGAGAGDVASVLAALNYNYTSIIHTRRPDQHPEAAWIGKEAPYTPGSGTYAYKTLSGITAATYTATQLTRLATKRCNYYLSLAGVSHTYPGKLCSNRFIDIQRTIDWLGPEIQANIFEAQVNNRKIPFTAAGFAIIEKCIRQAFDQGVANGAFSADAGYKYTVTMPALSAVSSANKTARHLPGITATAALAGAVQTIAIMINLSV
jgi:hypothetical protein